MRKWEKKGSAEEPILEDSMSQRAAAWDQDFLQITGGPGKLSGPLGTRSLLGIRGDEMR